MLRPLTKSSSFLELSNCGVCFSPYLSCLIFITWFHIDNLAALSGVTAEPQISDPFAPEPTATTAPTTDTTTTTAAAAAAATAPTVTAATAEVDLFGG